MIDETTEERLSRYLDGDLGNEESRDFEKRMESDEELRRELELAGSLREKMRRMAREERAPEALDRNLRLLRRAARPQSRRWAGVGIIGTAAAVVLVGSIVILETGRTGWRSWTEPPTVEKREVFALSNPPARDDDAPIGAIESLLADDYEEPEIGIPEALEIVGPLQHPPPGEGAFPTMSVAGIRLEIRPEGLIADSVVEFLVESGLVTACDVSGDGGAGREYGFLCGVLLSTEVPGIEDGKYGGRILGSVSLGPS